MPRRSHRLSLFPERAQQDVWGSNPDAWVAGSLAPHGDAKAVEGGWRVTGKWMWASGSLHAQWAACGIHMNNDKGETVNFGLSLMPMSELTIEDTWFVAGMKGTGSNTIVAKDVFVPEHRFLPYPAAFAGSYRTEHTNEIGAWHVEHGGLQPHAGAASHQRPAPAL